MFRCSDVYITFVIIILALVVLTLTETAE